MRSPYLEKLKKLWYVFCRFYRIHFPTLLFRNTLQNLFRPCNSAHCGSNDLPHLIRHRKSHEELKKVHKTRTLPKLMHYHQNSAKFALITYS